mmetsp:Transcript_46358/g.121650  ORF Transcript_46358/g.121650 Transcript_46358/m.121650 type:complete len:244 (+) Transcript_46358:1040-1771(+)
MITSLELLSSSAVESMSVNVASPSGMLAALSPAVTVEAVPKPPRSTETMLRFMATHMMCVRIAPDEPMSAPTVVSRGWSSMKPSAQSAQPEYELSTVMTTGMSAPPIDAVMCQPSAPDRPVIPSRHIVPTAIVGFAMKRAMQPSVPTPMPMFSWSRMERASGAEDMLPLSLPKATIEPVAVTPPMTVAREMAVVRRPSSDSGWCAACSRKSPTPVKTAARPTSEWKAATVCGSDVGSTRLAIM